MRLIPIGQVGSAHGLRGEVKFRYYNAIDAHVLSYPAFFFEEKGKLLKLLPSSVHRHKGLFLIKFKDLNAPEEVAFLQGKELSVREEDLPRLEEGEWYDFQLMGLDVMTQQGRMIGKITDVLHVKSNDVLTVTGDQEFLIPLVEDFVVKIDLDGSCVTVKESALVE
jgi:16S rRNA processing protein RimM